MFLAIKQELHLYFNNFMSKLCFYHVASIVMYSSYYRNSLIFRLLKFHFKNFRCEKFSSMFRFSFFREEKLKVRKIFVKSLSDENFSMTKKGRFTVYKLLCIFSICLQLIKTFRSKHLVSYQ